MSLRNPFRALLAFLAVLPLACHLGPEEEGARFHLEADSAWSQCDTVTVVLLDEDGAPVDTLFRDSLSDVDALKDLSAASYAGGSARVLIRGSYRDGGLCLEQTRSFEAGGTRMVVDTIKDPGARPRELLADHDTLDLVAGGPGMDLIGRILPAYADQAMEFLPDSAGVADLAPVETTPGTVRVSPVKPGEGWLVLRSRMDPSRTARVKVRVTNSAPGIVLRTADTTLSIGDSLELAAEARDPDNALAWLGWDCRGDGLLEDSVAVAEATGSLALGCRYPDSGVFEAVFRAVDRFGAASEAKVAVTVARDAPVADAGPDFKAVVGSTIRIPAGGRDGLGILVKREFAPAGGDFVALSGADTSFRAPAEPGTFSYVIRVTDDDNLSDEDTVEVTVLLSSNAELATLSLSAGALDPAFRPGTENYSVRVAFADSLVKVRATAQSPEATLTVNGRSTPSGAESEGLRVPVGDNVEHIQMVVTAPDGTQKVYRISVVREASREASLASLEVQGATLRPAFESSRLDYHDTVAHAVSSVVLKPAAFAPGAAISVDGGALPPGAASRTVPLAVGENLLRVDVTSADGTIMTAYRYRVTRLARLVILSAAGASAPTVVDSFDLPLGSARVRPVPAPAGHRFTCWRVVEGAADVEDSAMVDAAVTIRSARARVQAEFALRTYRVSASANAGGTITPAGDTTVEHGRTLTYLIKPQVGWNIQSVKVDGEEDFSGRDGQLVLSNLDRDRTVAVRFGRTFAMMSSSEGSGTVQPSGTFAVNEGDDVTYTITPFPEYRILHVLVDGADSAAAHSGSFTFRAVSAPHELRARFLRTYAMSSEVVSGRGRIIHQPRADSLGGFVYRIKPDPGYRLLSLLDNGQPVTPTSGDTSYVLTGVTSPHTLEARFLARYTITLETAPGGTLSADQLVVDSGAGPVKITIMPANPSAAYMNRFEALYVNGAAVTVSGGRSGPRGQHDYVIEKVESHKRVRARFMRIFSVTAINAGGPSAQDTLLCPMPGGTYVDSGATVTCYVAPTSGRVLSSLQDNNIEVKAKVEVNRYVIPGIAENHGVVATFAAGATYRVYLSTDFTPISDRVSWERPRVCLRIAGKEACDTAFSVVVPAATPVAFRADTSWSLCGMNGSCTRFPWESWHGLPASGHPNPTGDIPLQAPLNVRALYSKTGIPFFR